MLRFDWTPDARARSGLSAKDIAGALRPIFNGTSELARVDVAGDIQLAVRLAVAVAENMDVDRIAERPMRVGDSTSVQLGQFATYRMVDRPSAIERIDQQYRRFISVDFRGPGEMADAFIKRELDAFTVPVGYSVARTSFAFLTEDVEGALGWMILATVLLVFIITAAVFESWKLPILVILSVPMAAVGVSIGFVLTGANFEEGAFIGTILMIGIAVNDSILLVDRYRRLREMRPTAHHPLMMRLAVRERLRPMVTTSLTSIAAMVPMIIFPDESDFWIGLAVTVIGGLTGSTLLSPVMTVAWVSLRARRSRRRIGLRSIAARVHCSTRRNTRDSDVKTHDDSLLETKAGTP
ncbi:MAG: efflux RND transporter permease subunit [Rhodothermales bacterium]|nr:efflux RND transporter permease subunit [Rhodothermales bacterium]